jgi:hypothetical protein
MMRFAADENFNGRILRGLQAKLSDFDVVRVQDTDLLGASDPELLEWLAQEQRILLTHDVKTMPGFVAERVRQGLAMPGVIEVRRNLALGKAIDELEVLIGAGRAEDFDNLIWYVPT